MFRKNFMIEVIRTDRNSTVTMYMKGTRKEIKHDVEMYKEMSDRYLMIGNDGMIIWTNKAV